MQSIIDPSKIAEYLLKIKAVRLSTGEPFTWTSGWRSPIYCDNRMILSHPEIRKGVKNAFVSMVKSKYPEATAIAGVATGGIAMGALVAEELGFPFIYVRPSPKSHGLQNQIEGEIDKEAKYVVIEDLISTGSSSAAAVMAIQNAGGSVLSTVAIFGYGFPTANTTFAQTGTPFHTLTNLKALLDKATEMDYIQKDQMATIFDWQSEPEAWGN